MSCTWPVDRTCLPVSESEPERIKQEHAEDLAVSVLWALSGRQFGICPVIARPCPTACTSTTYDLLGGPGWFPLWDGANWRNVRCGCTGKCEATGPTVIHLGSTKGLPIQEVTEVRIAGEIMDPSLYSLEGDLLYRRGGAQWPNQDLTLPLDEPGTWSVSYTQGNPPPAGTATLVALLAKEFLDACGGGKCRLPRRVQTVSRQGVTYNMIDPTDIYRDGLTGLPEVDIWIASVNPHRISRAPRVR